MEKLQKSIFYEFNNVSLLKQALTHRSVSKSNNERLEFLGDSILGCVISQELYNRFPLIDEGQLSRLRSSLVKGQTLAKLAKGIDLSDNLILGQGELKSGGFRRESIQADAFEAILGAILLDSDYKTVKGIILKLYDELLEESDPEKTLKDFKTQLQELLQKKGYELPQYKLVDSKGKDHNAIFYVSCHIKELKISVHENAKSIKRAEQLCAESILKSISYK